MAEEVSGLKLKKTKKGTAVVSVKKAKKERDLWKTRTKKAGQYQRPIARALKKSAEALVAAAEVQDIVGSMNDKGRKLFSALTMGMSEAEAVYQAGLEDFYIWPHMRKVVTMAGDVVPIQDINILMIKKGMVHPESLKKMNEVAAHAMDVAGRNHDYSMYIRDINDAFKIVAPEAFRVMNEVMMDPFEKGQTRLNAAEAVLDRGGYKVKDEGAPNEMPAQVNILIQESPQGSVEVINGDNSNS